MWDVMLDAIYGRDVTRDEGGPPRRRGRARRGRRGGGRRGPPRPAWPCPPRTAPPPAAGGLAGLKT